MAEGPLLERVKRSDQPTLVYVWAPWCHPCKRMAPAIARLQEAHAGQVDLVKVNADQEPDLVRQLNVFGVPTLILFQQGREVTRQVGAQSDSDLQVLFEAAGQGLAPVSGGIKTQDRLLRLLAGLALVGLALATGPSWLLLLAGGVVLFSAVADHCPLWRMAGPRLKALLSGG